MEGLDWIELMKWKMGQNGLSVQMGTWLWVRGV